MSRNILIRDVRLITWLVKYLYFSVATTVVLMIIFKSIDYLQPDFASGFFAGKQDIHHWYKWFLYAHMAGGPLAFFCGVFQFMRKQAPIHRAVGMVYVLAVLLLAGPSGLVMALRAIGGPGSQISFGLLALLWMFFTYRAFHYAIRGQYALHEQWITRSFILTNSAILLRLLSFLHHHFLLMDIHRGYVVISWLSWLPWWLIYELILWRRQRLPVG